MHELRLRQAPAARATAAQAAAATRKSLCTTLPARILCPVLSTILPQMSAFHSGFLVICGKRRNPSLFQARGLPSATFSANMFTFLVANRIEP